MTGERSCAAFLNNLLFIKELPKAAEASSGIGSSSSGNHTEISDTFAYFILSFINKKAEGKGEKSGLHECASWHFPLSPLREKESCHCRKRNEKMRKVEPAFVMSCLLPTESRTDRQTPFFHFFPTFLVAVRCSPKLNETDLSPKIVSLPLCVHCTILLWPQQQQQLWWTYFSL